ncbi:MULTISPECIES: rhodanese-like domain-containing protein [unclassified Vibrio]|uniref:rhodanese-like domain-containing protein n=1 Tax=unclassified Vibrio TaxID=2614977 RepID=UPI001493D444|nr:MULTISPECIES: rhodanese-like domain-containing protein [unclassified Vibrio]NOI65203.1 rhodanese-like domain-containing protein [Vibrio sp. 99-8-1]
MFKKLTVIVLSLCAFFAQASERAEQAWQLIDQGALLVDVRTPQEFADGHLDNAINYPLNTVTTAFNNVDKNRLIVVYCRSGNRSGQALRYLKQVGYTRVFNGGGLQELLKAKP